MGKILLSIISGITFKFIRLLTNTSYITFHKNNYKNKTSLCLIIGLFPNNLRTASER